MVESGVEQKEDRQAGRFLYKGCKSHAQIPRRPAMALNGMGGVADHPFPLRVGHFYGQEVSRLSGCFQNPVREPPLPDPTQPFTVSRTSVCAPGRGLVSADAYLVPA